MAAGPGSTAEASPAPTSATGAPGLYPFVLSSRWLLPVAALLALVAQALPSGASALALYATAVGLFLLALRLGRRAQLPAVRLFPTRAGPYWLLLAGAAASLGIGLLTTLPSQAYIVEAVPQARPGPSYWPVAALWVLSLVAYYRAFAAGWPTGVWRRAWSGGPTELVVALLLVGLGLGLRAAMLDGFPRTFGGDEASQALSALGVVRGSVTNMFATGWYGTATLSYFLQAVPLAFVPDPVVGSRLTSALVGTAALAVTYLLARALCGRLVALLALAFLATFDLPHLL